MQNGRGREGAGLEAEEGLGRRSGRSRSRRRQAATARPLIVDPDYFAVPPQPIEFPMKFTTFVESDGRKGIKKRPTAAGGGRKRSSSL